MIDIKLNDIKTWEQNFGLLPLRLHPNIVDDPNYILLNGSYGNFCLNIEEQEIKDDKTYNSLSWSSSTNNFLVLYQDNINLYNWKKDTKEIIPIRNIENNFNRFYQYIIDNSYKSESEKDIVSFIIDIFTQFRNFIAESKSVVDVLSLLFILLLRIEDSTDSIFEEWGLDNVDIPTNFESYLNKLKEGFPNRKPDLDSIIRHSSGVLFQEAQKEVLLFDRQLDLWNMHSTRIDLKQNLSSSFHYTPPYLARTIVENSIRELKNSFGVLNLNEIYFSLKILDPACGSSEFLIEALKQLHNEGYLGTVVILALDSSEVAIKISEFRLNYEKITIWKERLNFETHLVEDSLYSNWGSDYDLILMNPPFVSWELMDKSSKYSVNEVFSSNAIKITKPNEASAFFYRAAKSLKNKGVIGCVIPTSLLVSDYYKKLRDDVYQFLNIKLLGKLGNFIFENALTDISLIVASKKSNNENEDISPYLVWTRNEKGVAQLAFRELRKFYYKDTINSESVGKDYSIYKPNQFPIMSLNWKIVSFQEYKFLKNLVGYFYEKKLVKIGDVFNVHQGIRTGNNKAFKISKAFYLTLPEKERSFFRPAIDNYSIENGKIFDNSYVWYPYNESELIIKTERDLMDMVPVFYNDILLHYKNDLLGGARRNESNWWKLSEHRAWLRKNEPRLVSTEFGRSTSFSFDKEGIFAIERGNAWLPKNKKQFKEKDSYYFYLSVFTSPFFDKLLSIYSKNLLSGWDLGKKYTENIPIPNIVNKEFMSSIAYQNLVKIGKELLEGNFYFRTIADEILLEFFYPEI